MNKERQHWGGRCKKSSILFKDKQNEKKLCFSEINKGTFFILNYKKIMKIGKRGRERERGRNKNYNFIQN